MKVKDLQEIAKYSAIELHSGFDGKMVASNPKSIEHFGEAEILSIMPQIKVTKNSCDYARAFLYVFVDHADIKRIKSEHPTEKGGAEG